MGPSASVDKQWNRSSSVKTQSWIIGRPPPVILQLQLSDDRDTEAVVELLDVLQQDAPGFDEMLVEVRQTIETYDITQKPVNNDQNP